MKTPRIFGRLTPIAQLCLGALCLCFLSAGCDDDEGGSGGGSGPEQDQRPRTERGEPPAPPRDLGADQVFDVDMVPQEESPCEGDDGCLRGRICVMGACQDADCVRDEDCPGVSPRCFGEPDEEALGELLRGRCGDCEAAEDCRGGAVCEPFQEGTAGGTCVGEEGCEGSLDCPPFSRLNLEEAQLRCVDRRDSDRAPICEAAFDCNTEGNSCPVGLTCLPSGACVTSGAEACIGSESCGLSEVCREDTGRCGPCARDSECAPAQRCEAGRCAEIPGDCVEDSDCLGSRRCVVGDCAPPACEDDSFMGNSEAELAAELDGDRLYRRLVSCSDDWFRFELPPSIGALITVRQRDRGADLGLLVLDEAGRELGRSLSAAPIEGVRLIASPAPRSILIRVLQEGPLAATEYDLEISYHDPSEVCRDDARELNGGDDEAARATIIRPSVSSLFQPLVEGQICPEDLDYYCFEARSRERLTVSGEILVGDTLLTGELQAPSGRPVAEGQWAADLNPNDIDVILEEDGLFCLILSSEVEGTRRVGSGRYQLTFNAVSPELAALCEESERIELNEGRGGAFGTLSGEGLLAPSCSEADGPEVAHDVVVREPTLLVARLAGVASGTLGAPTISLRGRCDQGSSELACAAATRQVDDPFVPQLNPVSLRAPIIPPVDPVTGEGAGLYTLILDGSSVGEEPSYQLDVELRPLAPSPLNDRCGEAEEILFDDDGVAVLEASLDQARDDLPSCFEGDGPDVVYSFELAEPSFVSLQVGSRPSEFPVLAWLTRDCGSEQRLSCGFGFDERLEAGRYQLVLDGLDRNGRGRVEAQLAVTPLPSVPENDDCAGAIVLDPAGGQLNGDTRGASDGLQLPSQNACTRDNSAAPELVYELDIPPAGPAYEITAIPQEGWDLSLYLLSSCEGEPAESCVIGQDGALSETIRLEGPARPLGPHLLIVDGANGEAGPFELRWGPVEAD